MEHTVSEPLEFASKEFRLEKGSCQLEASDAKGLYCTLYGETINRDQIKLKLRFSWEDDEVEKLTGTVTLMYNTGDGTGWRESEIPVNFLKRRQCIEQIFDVKHILYTKYKCSLAFHRAPANQVSYDAMFAPSMQHDGVLLIGEKKLHVNKAFLSYHSIYFRDLFVARNGEGDGIPIENVSFEDFGLLMSTIYPDAVQATYKTAETLLKLGNRFEIPAVMHHVENQLLQDITNESKFTNERLILLADKYGWNRLMRKAIREINCLDKAGKIGGSVEYGQMSDSAKAKISDKIMQFILIP